MYELWSGLGLNVEVVWERFDLRLVLNTESVENLEAESGNLTLNLTVKMKTTLGKTKEIISSCVHNFWNCSSFVYGICLESLPYFKKYFCTESFLLNPSDVVIIHSKAFYCLGSINKVNTQGVWKGCLPK